MSWYFFGGFSAYAIEPSAALVNHSGCSATHGWSGAHCSARSSATSRPSSPALRTNASKSSSVPSSRVDRVVAALGRADRPRRADVVRLGDQRVVAALAVDLADRVDRRQVDDVEAHRGDGRQPLGRGRERAVHRWADRVPAAIGRPPPPTAGRTRTRPRTVAALRSTQIRYGADRVTSSRTGYSHSRSARSSAGDTRCERGPCRCRASAAAAASTRPARPAARSRAAGSAPRRPRRGRWRRSSRPWPASIFARDVAPRSGTDRRTPRRRTSTGRSRPAPARRATGRSRVARHHPGERPAHAVRPLPDHVAAQRVVAFPVGHRGHRHQLADHRFRRVPATAHDRGNLLDGDASSHRVPRYPAPGTAAARASGPRSSLPADCASGGKPPVSRSSYQLPAAVAGLSRPARRTSSLLAVAGLSRPRSSYQLPAVAGLSRPCRSQDPDLCATSHIRAEIRWLRAHDLEFS